MVTQSDQEAARARERARRAEGRARQAPPPATTPEAPSPQSERPPFSLQFPQPGAAATPTATSAPPPPSATPTREQAPPPHRYGEIGETVDEGTNQEHFTTWLDKSYQNGETITLNARFPRNKFLGIPYGDKPVKPARYRVLSKSQEEGGLFRYELQDATIFPGWNPLEEFGSLEGYEGDILKFIPLWDNLGKPHAPNEMANFVSQPPAELRGQSMDVLEAYQAIHGVLNTLRAFRGHLDNELPEAIEGFREAALKASNEGQAKFTTMDTLGSTVRALNTYAEKYPENYTQRLGTEEGMAELGQIAFHNMVSAAPPEVSAWDDPRGFIKAVEEAYLPEVPFLKDTVIRATEIFTDPYFLATLAVLPPVGVASKAKLLAELSAGGAIGEETAETLGLSETTGGFLGMMALPAATRIGSGFVKAAMEDSVARARVNPTMNEPATDFLRLNGEVLELPQLRRLLTEQPFTTPAGVRVQESAQTAVENRLGRHVLTAGDAEGVEVGRLQWREPAPGQSAGHIVDVVAQTERQGIGTSLMQETLDTMAVRGIPQATGALNSEGGVRLFNRFKATFQDIRGKPLTAEEAQQAARTGQGPIGTVDTPSLPAAISGGAPGKSMLNLFDDLIRIHIERPEANDLLRKLARGMGHIPGAKRAVEIVNRQALADSPTLKGAFGFEAMTQYDNALRRGVMAEFQGARVPFRQNWKAQIFVPKSAVGKEGEWIATGDVFESVMKGESRYLNRLTAEQVSFIQKAQRVFEPFVRQSELLTGERIGKRSAWWPRFIDDVPNRKWTVNAGPGRPPGMFQRVVESQEEAITQMGIRYKPDILKQMETAISGFQRLNRQVTLSQYLKREGIVSVGRPPTRKEVFATDIVPQVGKVKPGVISIENMNEIKSIMGPGTRNPLVTLPDKVNAVARLMLTGVLDTGVGALQLTALFALSPAKWSEAMGRSFYNMLVEPKQFYRFLQKDAAAREYMRYGGAVGLESEFFEAAKLGLPFRVPEALHGPVDVATWPFRTLVHRMQTGFDAALSYGRILAFDSLRGPATKPGPLLKAFGATALEGKAYHDEMFRLARFTDTLIGQPSLHGLISKTQQQVESAYVWFATRYTRSLLGTASYLFGKGYTPAMARSVMSRMLIGGMATYSGFVYALGKAQGKSDHTIQNEIATGLNPANGKKFLSLQMGDDWYGMGGLYRAGLAALGTLGNTDNWNMETWEERTLDNPFVRIWRSRTSPISGTLMDFLEGENFLGDEVNFWEMVDNPEQLASYGLENYIPFTLNAVLQDGSWERRTARGIFEFFGLRTSPQSTFEAMTPVMDRVSEERFGVPFDGLKNNLPAQDLVRNHPSVKAIEATALQGIAGLPPLQSSEEKKWDIYRGLRDTIRDTYATKKSDLDGAFQSGRISGKDYRDEYQSIATAEFNELLGTRNALFESLGLEFAKEDAPAGSVDAALRDYFAVQVDAYTNTETRQIDWDSFFADRDAALAQVPQEHQELVDTYLSRHQGQIAKDFRAKFEAYLKPSHYFDLREQTAEALGIPINELENAAIASFQSEGRRASPSDIGDTVEGILDFLVSEKYGDNAPTISGLKNFLREHNPQVDLELYRQGYVTTVRSNGAIALAIELDKTSPDLGYTIPPLADDIIRSQRR